MPLPERIYIASNTEAFTIDYYFALDDGKIYFKRNQEIINDELIYSKLSNQNPADYNEWQLLEPNGRPYCKSKPGVSGLPNSQFPKTVRYEPPKRIVEIRADNTTLVAMSEDGHFYYSYLNAGSKFYHLKGWTDRWGSPKKILYYEPALFKAWGVGRRGPKVHWFSDPDGYRRSYSGYGLSTLYTLSKDGRDIYFVDNGMPQTYTNIIAGPENGSFIAENMSISGDTIFLIDKNGNMYTRLADFDTIGDDVMLYKYTYKHLPLPVPNTGYGFNASQFWKEYLPIAVKLPPETWRKQPGIKLEKGACITSTIDILTSGRGNSGRELRITGKNSEGQKGYYYKNIFSDTWDFRVIDVCFDERDILSVNTGQIAIGEPYQGYYHGNFVIDKNLTLDAELVNYSPRYAPSTADPPKLAIGKGENRLELTLYMQSIYNPNFFPEDFPYPEPTLSLCTLVFPDEIKVSNKKRQAFYKKLKKRFHLKNYRFIVESGEDYARIYKRFGSKKKLLTNLCCGDVTIGDIDKRPWLDTYFKDLQGFTTLVEKKYKQAGQGNNAVFLKKIKGMRSEARKKFFKALISSVGFKIIQVFFVVTLTVFIPASMHFFLIMGVLFDTNARSKWFTLKNTRKDYKKALAVCKSLEKGKNGEKKS